MLEPISLEELTEAAWRSGDLSYKYDPHQQVMADSFEEWNARRHTDAYRERCEQLADESGSSLDDVWVDEMGRRVGKTARWIIGLGIMALRYPGAVLTYGTALDKDISEIVVPLARMLFADGPDDLRPQFQRSKAEGNRGLYWPNGSVIKLVGMDLHPNAIRGRFSDTVVLSEAGYMKGLEDLVRSIIMPLFQQRPWAFLALESSTPKEPEHDFTRIFVPDAKARGAYQVRTIDENPMIGPKEKAKFLRMAGGRGHPTCDREYYCEETRDPEELVIPEYSKTFVREHPRPKYALAMTAADPGFQDMFGQVWGYWDFAAAKLVIERSWARRNASTRQVAAVNAVTEYELWGRWCPKNMADIPLESTELKMGWDQLLKGERNAHLGRLMRMQSNTDAARRPADRWPIGHPVEHFTHWNGVEFVQNPCLRVSDIEPRLMQDFMLEFGLLFSPTAKDDLEAQINRVRDWCGAGRIVFLPDCGPVIDHVSAARWNDRRTDWDRHKTFGHFDCLAALIYMVRNCEPLRARNPVPPQFTDRKNADVASWYVPAGQKHGIGTISEGLGGRRNWR